MGSFIEELNKENKIKNVPNDRQIKYDDNDDKIQEYAKSNDDKKLSFIEKELLLTIKKIDMSIESLDLYEQQTTKIPYGIYDLKNKFLENRRQTLKHLFDIISHKQKLEKEDKGENFNELIKM